MRLEPIAVAPIPAGSESLVGEDEASGFARLLATGAEAHGPTPQAHGAGGPAAPGVKGRARDPQTDAEAVGQPAGSGVQAPETPIAQDPCQPLAALLPLPGNEAGLHLAEGWTAEAGADDLRQASGLCPVAVPETPAPMGNPASAGPAHAAPFPQATASHAGQDRVAAARTGEPSAAAVVPLPPGAQPRVEIAAVAAAAQRPAAPGRAAPTDRAVSKAPAAGESALQWLGERSGVASPAVPAAAQPSVAVMFQAQLGPFRNSSDLPSPSSAAPSAPASQAAPETAPRTAAEIAPEMAMPAAGPVQEIRLFAGGEEGLGVVLQVASERDREDVQREAPALLSDLAGVGAKVEAIRVELAGRSPQETSAGAAAGQSPGSGPGAGHPGKEESPARRFDGPEPAVRGALAARPVDHGGKVDRYA